jgi:hypothetical protein
MHYVAVKNALASVKPDEAVIDLTKHTSVRNVVEAVMWIEIEAMFFGHPPDRVNRMHEITAKAIAEYYRDVPDERAVSK